MAVNIKVTVNTARLGLDMDNALKEAVEATSQQALSDCNFYCKQDTGALIESSLIHSDLDKGILRWVTPYAEHQYTYPGTHHDKNPNAVPEWCQKAKEMCLENRWQVTFERTIQQYGGNGT